MSRQRDEAGARVRERVWVTKVDHSVDPPVAVEEVFVEDGQLMEVKTYGKEAEAEAGPEQASDVERKDGDQVNEARRMDPWTAIDVVASAARDAGIELERALKFLSAVEMGAKAARASGGVKQPEQKQ